MKRGIFINLLLRAYSQEVFLPTQIFGKGCSKDDFVDEVSDVFKDFIINNIAEDERAIRREVRIQYNQISF